MNSLNNFRIYFEDAPVSVQLLSPEGKTLAVNKAWKELWKIPEDVIQNYILKDYKVGEDPQLEAKGIAKFVRRGLAGETVEIPAILYDPKETGLVGEPQWVSGFMYPVHDSTGKIAEVILTHLNITKTKKAEEELRKSRDQLQVIFEGVADGILVQDKHYHCIYANEAGARMCGFSSSQEFCSASIEDLLKSFEIRDENGLPLSNDKLPARRALTGQGSQEDIVMRVHNRVTGQETWSRVSARPILDEKGNSYLAVSIFRDITEEKHRQERQTFLNQATSILSTSLDYYETLNKIAKLAVPRLADWCSVDVIEEDGPKTVAIVHSDPKMLKLAEELRQKYPPDWNATTGSPNVMRTGEAELYPHIPEELLKEATMDQEHYRLIQKLGLKSAMIVPLKLNEKIMGAITFIGAESGRVYSLTDLEMAKDLGQRSALALENAQLYRKAENALHARDEFFSICSHELKTPITSLKIHFQIAEKMIQKGDQRVYDPASIEKRIATTSRLLDRMVSLIDEMLDISRINAGKLSFERKSLDFRMLVSEMLSRFSDQFSVNGIEMKVDLENKPFHVLGDRFRLEQVISNLFTNVIKYGEGKPVFFSLREKKNYVQLEVSDEGIGIAPEYLDRVFNRFERVSSDTNVSGLGLGLYISKEIITAHEGKIWAQNRIPKGTSFFVELPLA